MHVDPLAGASGRPFVKMSGSGNDFVFVDAREAPPGVLASPAVVARICARGTGVGADGIVFLERSAIADVRMTYLNSDGSPAALCGNATLCTTRLASEVGAGAAGGMTIESGVGLIRGRMHGDLPEIDFAPVREVQAAFAAALEPGELRIGYAVAGVPHLTILCEDVDAVDLVRRGPPLRRHPSLATGANVNWVARGPDGRWRIRTFERGVEGETLACGTGSVASSIVLASWGAIEDSSTLITRSGLEHRVRFVREAEGGAWLPSLAGEGRIVFRGAFGEL